MKKVIIILIVIWGGYFLSAQPDKFTWNLRHYKNKDTLYNYISDAKNQKEQGPCGAFAAVAAVEAIAQIYFNKPGTTAIDLSESNIYSNNDTCGCPGVGCGSVGVITPLNLIKSSGIVDENCFEYPEEPLPVQDNRYCYRDCDCVMCDNPAYRVFIPHWDTIPNAQIADNTQLKKAIMDFGPIIVRLEGTGLGCRLHSDDPDCEKTNEHTVLFIGWETKSNNITYWIFKDSWPNRQDFFSDSINVFDWRRTFYRVYPVYNGDTIRCYGSNCSLFNSREFVDNDKDGFYNWGFDTYPKPSGCPGPDKMDFDDGDPNIIFRSGYTPLRTPFITGPSPSGTVCTSGATFMLDSVPPGFSVSWSVSPAYCFNQPYSGNGSSATVYPNLSCPGKKCTITFTISHNGSASYSKDFVIVGPREDLVSISVIDSYGGSPPKYGDIYYICPNTIYHIYYNNYDGSCSTWDYEWRLPYGWTEYWKYNNMISVNTNDYPYGMLEVYGKTCCENTLIKLKTQYFSDYYECGEYFMAFPNPANDYIEIDINREKMTEENIRTDLKCTLTMYDKTGLVKYKTEFKGFPFRIDTGNLPEGIYFINLLYNGKTYSMRVIIKH